MQFGTAQWKKCTYELAFGMLLFMQAAWREDRMSKSVRVHALDARLCKSHSRAVQADIAQSVCVRLIRC